LKFSKCLICFLKEKLLLKRDFQIAQSIIIDYFMCGIFGVVGEKLNIEKNLETIAHRGPDDQGEYQDDLITLGFRRLAIIDLSSAGHQPMTCENKNIWLVFNGEIYNYQALKKELAGNHSFRSQTDTEVLIHGYEEWGIDKLLRKASGMFAFCLYDREKKIFFLARDRIGKKPLYYYQKDHLFAFASETKAFFQLPRFRFQISPKAFSLWLGFPYLPDNRLTLLQNVHKIPAAHYLKFDLRTKKFRLQRYYFPLNKKNRHTFCRNQQKLEKLLRCSVKERLIADVPLAVLLSGGIDSSLITAIASRLKPNLNTITISFPGTITDESKYANLVAKHCKTRHTNLKIDARNIFEDFRENIWIYDDLSTSDPGLYSTFLLSKKIRENGIKVALVGEGADEVFCGYTWFGFGQWPFKILGHFIPTLGYYYAIMRVISKPNFWRYPLILNQKLKDFSGDLIAKIQKNEILNSLPNHYCMKLDKGSSAFSVETRAPYLDYRLVDFALNLPAEQKIEGQWYHHRQAREKFILRQIARKYLPLAICQRKKRGGMTPTKEILENGLIKYQKKIIQNSLFHEYFSQAELKNLITKKPRIKPLIWQREWVLWKFLIFQIWHEYYQQY